MKTFVVYGGCITRDIFNFLNNEEFKPVLTIGQNPISTMFEDPFEIQLEDFRIGKNFQKRMLYYDANKLALEKIQETESDYFIFDVICERITIMEFELDGKRGCVEKSWGFVNNWFELKKDKKYEKLKKIRDINVLDIMDNTYEQKVKKFCELISQKYDQEHIIFVETELSDRYFDKNNGVHKFNEKNGYHLVSGYNMPEYGNKVIKTVEKMIKKYLPNIHYIPMPQSVLGDEKHHFGIHPLHYQASYYEYAATAIKCIVKQQDHLKTKEILKQLCQLQSLNNEFLLSKMRKDTLLDYRAIDNGEWEIPADSEWRKRSIDGRVVLLPAKRKFERIFLKLNQQLFQDTKYHYDIKCKIINDSEKQIRIMLTDKNTQKGAYYVIASINGEMSDKWIRIEGDFICNREGYSYLMITSTDFSGENSLLYIDWIQIEQR